MNAGNEDNRIAIIGMAARVPGARDVDEFWSNLVNGVESLTELSDEVLRAAGVSEEQIADPRYVRLVPLMGDMEGFDAAYFKLSPREAEISDPQQRIFLEICNTAIQHAGYDVTRYTGRAGVFGGSSPNRYATSNVYSNTQTTRAASEISIEVSNQIDYLATRVAYTLGLTGPAVSVATACSTSLVAVHLAIRSLLAGECDMALAGGVSVELPYYVGRRWTENSIYSRDGHVRAFDAAAQGTNFGHGAAAVVLKRYTVAVADGDRIHGVVLGSAVNNDGARRVGFTAPGLEGQASLITATLANAGVEAASIGLVEAHGTATLVGDPIEVAALSEAYRLDGATGDQVIPIGSVKTNIGHLGPASGAAGLIKAIRAVETGLIPPSLHFEQPNPNIPFERTPFYVNASLAPWPERGGPRRAAVSSFGIGGTNAHLIIEQPPAQVASVDDNSWHVLPLSARSPSALATMAEALADRLVGGPPTSLADVSYTLQMGRPALAHRSAVTCRDVTAAVAQLRAPITKTAPVRASYQPSVVFMFPGQGAQYAGMAEEIYRREPVFRAAFDQCADLAREHLGDDLREVVFAGEHADGEKLRQTRLTQPALFAVEYALAQLWRSRGVQPWAMIGHSVGEFVAACLAEVFTLAEAVELVVARGRLMQAMPPGVMLAVPLPEADVLPQLGATSGVAAVNTFDSCVVSGPRDEIEALADRFAERGVATQRLWTSHAFHSPMMDPVVPEFLDLVSRVGPKPPTRDFVSTRTGTWISAEEAIDPDYWAGHLRDTVRFAEACATLADTDVILLEVGPRHTLSSLARQVLAELSNTAAVVVPSLSRMDGGYGDEQQLAKASARLWTGGVPLEWQRLHHSQRRRATLPTYPYERQRFWIDPDPDPVDEHRAADHGSRPTGTLAPADSTFVPVWLRQPHSTPLEPGTPGEVWLVFSPGEGPVEEAAARLSSAGVLVVRVAEGRSFGRVGNRRYRIAPGERADYVDLLDEISERYGRPTAMLHGWTAGRAATGPIDPAVVADAQESGFLSLLFLSQVLAERWPDEEMDLRIVTSNCFDVSGVERVEPAKSLLVGPAMVVPTEHKALRTQLIDLSRPLSGPDNVDLDGLMVELRTPVTDRFVAHRGRLRWTRRYVPVQLPMRDAATPRIRPGGAYLITGGLGGIGLAVAKELAATARARVVLVGRSPLPDRAEWDEHLANHDDDDATSLRIRGVRDIEKLGGEVMLVTADVCDESAMRAVVESVHRRFGPMAGVFHAAGVPGGGLVALRSRAQAEQVLAPKVNGTLVLHRLLGAEVEIFVLFSSIISVTGDFGMVDYCSGNAFLDAFAHFGAGDPQRVRSINWCGWSEVGMVRNTRQDAPQLFRDIEAGLEYQPASHPLLDRRITGHGEDLVFTATIGPDFHWVVTEHRIAGEAVLPGTAYAELIRAAFVAAQDAELVEISDLVFAKPLRIDGRRELRVIGREQQPGVFDVEVVSRPVADLDAWQRHARGRITAAPRATVQRRDMAAIDNRCNLLTWQPDLNGTDSGAVEFGPRWLNVESVRMGEGEQLVTIQLPARYEADCAEFVLHPALLDGATALSLYLPEVNRGGASYLPIGFRRMVVREALPSRFYSHLRDRSMRESPSGIYTYDVELLDDTGRVLVTIDGFAVRSVDIAAVRDAVVGGEQPAATDRGGPPRTGIGDYLITPDEGIDLLWRMLDDTTPNQVVISREPVEDKLARMAGLAAQLDQATATAGADSATAVGPLSDANDTEAAILALWHEMLGASHIGMDDDFFELGGNSLVAVHLAVRMREHFGITVSGITILEHATIRALAATIDDAIAASGKGRDTTDEGEQR